MKGIAYGPVPQKEPGPVLSDDFMAQAAKPLWGSTRGRGDLAIMHSLGANAVRLYGNDPDKDHHEFLDTATSEGLGVIAGQSDWPFTQMMGNCLKTTNFDCYKQVKESYLGNLQHGFLKEDRSYHPGLSYFVIVNEPDLKLPGIEEPRSFSKAIISAVDGIVDAEKEMNVTGRLVTLTVAFSFAVCDNCVLPSVGKKPALGQMLQLRNAFQRPEQYGYFPHNNLANVYATRFVNCFNTQNPFDNIRPMFLDAYEEHFPDMPVFIGEYHAAMFMKINQLEDLQNMLEFARSSSLLLGIVFFEYQVRYDKGGTEENFGMFGLGNYSVSTIRFPDPQPVWCLQPEPSVIAGMPLPDVVSTAFEGSGVDLDGLCFTDPHKVPLTQAGFMDVLRQHRPDSMLVFVERVTTHYGGRVVDRESCQLFAQGMTSFQGLLAALEQQPSWAFWDPYPACIADRHSDTASLSELVGELCNRTWFNCGNIPASCKESSWLTADYVLSEWHNEELLRGVRGPLDTCYFNGAAVFAPAAVYRKTDSTCIVTRKAQSTVLTDEGLQAITNQHNPVMTAVFIRRLVTERLLAKVADESKLMVLAEASPAPMYRLMRILREVDWVCGGDTGRRCPPPRPTARPSVDLWWRKYGYACLAALVFFTVLAACICIRFPDFGCWSRRYERIKPDHESTSGTSDVEEDEF